MSSCKKINKKPRRVEIRGPPREKITQQERSLDNAPAGEGGPDDPAARAVVAAARARRRRCAATVQYRNPVRLRAHASSVATEWHVNRQRANGSSSQSLPIRFIWGIGYDCDG